MDISVKNNQTCVKSNCRLKFHSCRQTFEGYKLTFVYAYALVTTCHTRMHSAWCIFVNYQTTSILLATQYSYLTFSCSIIFSFSVFNCSATSCSQGERFINFKLVDISVLGSIVCLCVRVCVYMYMSSLCMYLSKQNRY